MRRNDPRRYPTQTIKPRRQSRGITQMQLASQLGVQLITVQQWERDVYAPNPENARKLDAILGRPAKEQQEP